MSAARGPACREAGLAGRIVARIEGFAAAVQGLTGWPRRLAALLAGALSALALAPFFLWPVLALTLPVLIWLIDGALARGASHLVPTPLASKSNTERRVFPSPPRAEGAATKPGEGPGVGGSQNASCRESPPPQPSPTRGEGEDRLTGMGEGEVGAHMLHVARASGPFRPSRHTLLAVARIGWLFGFGYFLAGLFWIGVAFLVEAEKFAVLLPFAVTLMPAGLALFYAGATALAALAWRPGFTRVLALALALGAMEWLKGHVLTGFPWNTLGYALTYPLVLMQSASLLGIYALTILTVLILAGPLGYLSGPRQGVMPAPRRIAIAATLLVAPLAVLAVGGAMRLAAHPEQPSSGPLIRIVQPSVPQREKWRPENQGWIFRDHLTLSETGPSGAPGPLDGYAAVVWPEAAMPFLPLDEPRALEAIAAMLPEGGHLVTGALRQEKAPRGRRIFNSLIAIGKSGQPAAIYDKIHLVPFGEYLPFQSTLEAVGLEQLTRIRGGFDTGNWPRKPLSIGGLPPIGPLVCYEAIFPGAAIDPRARPALLLNVTNDGWFGRTTGPHQHFHQARVRAVEEGLPLVRAANNGISALVDPLGRVLHRLDLDVRGVIDARLPSAIAQPVYARLGNSLFWLLLAGGVALLLAMRRKPSD